MKSFSQFIVLLMLIACANVAQGQETEPVKKKEGIVRQKFFFSIGAGASLVSAYSEIYSVDTQQSEGGNISKGGFSTTFRMGGTIAPYWVIYYENKVCYARTNTLENYMTSEREALFGYSITGLGVTRFLKPTMPSYFFNATVGIAGRMDSGTVSAYAEKGTGFGMALGAGYQFANRWSWEANLIYGNVSGKPKYDMPWESRFVCLQVSINYLYFKSYKLDRLKRQSKL